MNYLSNTSNFISKIRRFPQALELSFQSNSRWQNIKKFHLMEKEKTNFKLSDFCKTIDFRVTDSNLVH